MFANTSLYMLISVNQKYVENQDVFHLKRSL